MRTDAHPSVCLRKRVKKGWRSTRRGRWRSSEEEGGEAVEEGGELPEGCSEDSIYGTLWSNEGFSNLIQMMNIAGFTDTFCAGDLEVTFFAPTDEAFEAWDEEALAHILGNADPAQEFILNHGLSSTLSPLVSGEWVNLNGGEIQIVEGPEGWLANGEPVLVTDIPVSNGAFHILGSVMFEENYFTNGGESGEAAEEGGEAATEEEGEPPPLLSVRMTRILMTAISHRRLLQRWDRVRAPSNEATMESLHLSCAIQYWEIASTFQSRRGNPAIPMEMLALSMSAMNQENVSCRAPSRTERCAGNLTPVMSGSVTP